MPSPVSRAYLKETPVSNIANDQRIYDLTNKRAKALQSLELAILRRRRVGDNESKRTVSAVQAMLTDINTELKACGDVSRAIHGAGVVKTKREFVGELLAWAEQMQDANKNPKTTEAEKLFNKRALERISSILKASVNND